MQNFKCLYFFFFSDFPGFPSGFFRNGLLLMSRLQFYFRFSWIFGNKIFVGYDSLMVFAGFHNTLHGEHGQRLDEDVYGVRLGHAISCQGQAKVHDSGP
jgi:hypothetical protein